MTAENDIRGLVATFEKALNTGDADLSISCYTPDGMAMAAGQPTLKGADLLPAYREFNKRFSMRVAFTIDELIITGETYAYALTRSTGTQTIRATGAETAESNREMMIFRRDEGVWKIARYLFNQPE